MADDQYVYICSTSRETHIVVTEQLTDADWCSLARAIRADSLRVGKEKAAALKSLAR
jgi:hypothetical protein